MTTTVDGLDAFHDLVGKQIGYSEWQPITQERVNLFADATDDHQWIHVDPERAKDGPFGGAIAHGYLTLSLAPVLLNKVIRVDNMKFGVNYGANKIRFPSPVPVGSELRMGVTVANVEDVAGGVQVTYDLVMEVRDAPKPACVAQVVYRYFPLIVVNQPLPLGEEKTARVRSMFDAIAPRYDLVNRLMTFGLDQAWRRNTVATLALPEGSLLLDLACGTGDLSRLAEQRRYRVIGADLTAGMLAANRSGTPLVQADSTRLPFPDGTFDGLVCGYALRNFTDLAAALAETARVIRPGGRLAILEVDAPASAVLRTGYDIWFKKVVPRIGAALSDRDAYDYLPRSVAYLPPAPALRRLVADAGYSGVGIRPLAGGLSQLLFATRVGIPGP